MIYRVLFATIIVGIASIIAQINLNQSKSLKNIASKLETQVNSGEQLFNQFASDSVFMNGIVNNNANVSAYISNNLSNQVGLFLYRDQSPQTPQLLFWNSSRYFFNEDILLHADSSYFVRDINGDFEVIKRTHEINGINYISIGLVPIRWHYFIENTYLKSYFNNNVVPDKLILIKEEKTDFSINGINGKPLFYIDYLSGNPSYSLDTLTSILRFLFITFLLLLLYSFTSLLTLEIGFAKSFSLYIAGIIALRLIIYGCPYWFFNSDMALFDPTIYGSNLIHSSLGQLLINVILLASVLQFHKQYEEESSSIFNNLSNKIKEAIKLIIVLISGSVFAYTIKHLIQDSKISFDVSNFSSLNYYSLLGLIIIVVIIICYSRIILTLYFKNFDKKWPFPKAAVSVLVISIITFLVSILVIEQNNLIEIEQRKKISESLSKQDEEFGQNMIQIAVSSFKEKFLQDNYKRLYNEKSNKYIKDSIVAINFRGYLNRYDTKVYIFDSLHRNLFNDDNLPYNSLKEIVTCNSSSEGFEGLYSFTEKENTKNYLYEKTLIKNNDTIAYVFIVARPKSNYGNAIYPELFKQSGDGTAEKNNKYLYAIYLNNYLDKHSGNFAFPNKIQNESLFNPGEFIIETNEEGMSELRYKATKNQTIVIVRKNNRLTSLFTLFSYLLCLAVFSIALYRFINKIVTRFYPASPQIKEENFKYHFQAQIQTSIAVISILSLTIIGVVTVTLFADRFTSSNNERLTKSIESIVAEVESEIQSQLIYNDITNVHQLKGELDYLDRKVTQISEIHSVDINLFDAQGDLKLSTQPYIFNKHLLNDKIDPTVYYTLRNNNTSEFIHSENIGLLPYLSIYAPIRDENKKLIGFINIPYLNSQTELKSEVSNFLSALINLNTFIFLLAGAISFFVSKRITSSLVLIGNKMKEISLGNINEQIQWHKNDEIGVLVKEYNKMVSKLEISARLLAKNEREIAWREMAKQVAHEIKNPLTPMKLSLQYLQKAIDGNNNNIQQLTKQVANTLIEQIDQLARIASDFSQFANIENAHLETFDVFECINSVVNLYKMDTDIAINWERPNEACNIKADKTQIIRVFTNLIKNAIESQSDNNGKTVIIAYNINSTNVLLSVSDNGIGIPKSLSEKIFEPNFTTKTSGTGLGLAICKSIIENVHGKIYFESIAGVKTSFFVLLPLT